jgi:glycosyltransferase involved in cell wall biosynthesis
LLKNGILEREEALHINKPEIRVIHLARSVGPTSMVWTDLYRTALKLAPGMMCPPLAVSPLRLRTITQEEDCGGEKRTYFAAGPLSALFHTRKVYNRSRIRGQTLVLHVHSPVLGFLAVIMRLLCPKMRVVTNLHNEWCFFRWHQKIGLQLLSLVSDRFVTVSKAIGNTMPKKVSKRLYSKRALYAIPNAIESRRLEKIRGQNSRPDTAVVVARMVPQKNCLFIIQLIARTPSIKNLIWYGTGPEKEQIAVEVERLAIGERVIFRGVRPRDDVFQALADSSIYIAASKWEGIGVANLEAAALGCYPFLSTIPPHEEIAEALGIKTYPLDDMDAWINAIEAFLNLTVTEQGQKRRIIADATRRNYDLDLAVSKYIEIYRGLPARGN